MAIECVVCGASVKVESGIEAGEIVDCQACGVELEVLSREPVTVGVFEEEEK